jgi:hypothetical protein
MLNHLLVVHKHNLGVLMRDQMPQTLTFYNKIRHVSFSNKQWQIFHKFLLLRIILFIGIPIPKMIYDGPIINDKFIFGLS